MISRLLLLAAAILLPARTAHAGPPFVTDDPAVLAEAQLEILPYVDLVDGRGPNSGEAGVDTSIGILPGFQAGMIVPIHRFEGGRDEFALGDIALTLKFTLVEGETGGPAVALGPSISLPTASPGTSQVGLDLPLWIGIGHGAWSLYGGGGYRLGAAEDGGNRAFGGIVLHFGAHERVGLGGEIYLEAASDSTPSLAMAGAGFDWTLAPQVSLVAAGHAILANRRANGRFHVFSALVITP